jgi:hypothetical protein
MLMRYHWGLGAGHTYSHVRDSAVDQAKSVWANTRYSRSSGKLPSEFRGTSLRNPQTIPDGFNDLHHDVSNSDLEWEMPGTNDHGGVESMMEDTDANSDGFDDLDPHYSFADAFSWEMVQDEENRSNSGSDDDLDSDASQMYEMYGLDWGDGKPE